MQSKFYVINFSLLIKEILKKNFSYKKNCGSSYKVSILQTVRICFMEGEKRESVFKGTVLVA